MGWYGDYSHPEEVIAEKLRFSGGVEICGKKATRRYGAVLYRDGDLYQIDYFIFRDNCYKPLSWAEGIDHLPKSWISRVLPNATETEIKIYQEYMERKKAPTLDDVLVPGRTYRIWNSYTAKYRYKQKRSHIFELPDGSLTRFRRLEVQDLKELSVL